jgi:hypothetical protein
MDVPKYIQIAFVVVVIFTIIMFVKNTNDSEIQNDEAIIDPESATLLTIINDSEQNGSDREVLITSTAVLPIKNIVPSENVLHSIPLHEIKQGCSRKDCIPSIDKPVFVSTSQAKKVIEGAQLGIALSYKGEDKFYPFSMLVTHELVNDVVAGDPLLISYCPLCGTGVVFNRVVGNEVFEFGVSGMLWQANLLMYNRSNTIEETSLWSQVLGRAVVGSKAGQQLVNVSSDIMTFETWADQFPDALVLDSGSQQDPYNGKYFEVAERFSPDFDKETSLLPPDTYVYGIEIKGVSKAYPREHLPEGVIHDMIGDTEVIITNTNGRVTFVDNGGTGIADVEGFWFSWVATHPKTEIWSK